MNYEAELEGAVIELERLENPERLFNQLKRCNNHDDWYNHNLVVKAKQILEKKRMKNGNS